MKLHDGESVRNTECLGAFEWHTETKTKRWWIFTSCAELGSQVTHMTSVRERERVGGREEVLFPVIRRMYLIGASDVFSH